MVTVKQAVLPQNAPPLSHRRAGACPPPCSGRSQVREGQALALRCWGAVFFYRRFARDRPSRYGVGERFSFIAAFARDRPSRYGIGERDRKRHLHRRAGACPPPCLGQSKVREGDILLLGHREGQALALRCWGQFSFIRGFARDRPSRYGVEERFSFIGVSRGTGPRATVKKSVSLAPGQETSTSP